MPYITVQPAHRIIESVSDLSAGEFVAAIIGLTIGLVLGLLLGLPLANFPDPYGWLLPLGVSVVLGLGMMGLTVAKRDDLLDAARDVGLFRAPDARPGRRRRDRAPERAADLRRHQRHHRRPVRGRRRLRASWPARSSCRGSCSASCSTSPTTATRPAAAAAAAGSMSSPCSRRTIASTSTSSDEDVPDGKAVDAKLVALARTPRGEVLTNDYNLNRVAQLQGVRVLNLNELANALKPAFLPGEALRVKVIQEGKEPGQGVGYLDDGTMIVVEGGSYVPPAGARGARHARPPDRRRPDGLRAADRRGLSRRSTRPARGLRGRGQ